MKIAENVHFYKGREEAKLVRGAGSCNVIVLRGDNGGPQVMIDTGLMVGGSFDDLLNTAFADGIDLRKTDAVLHTHTHWDHISGDMIVQKEYGAKVYAHEWERTALESKREAFRSFIVDIGDFYGEVVGSPVFLMKLVLRYAGGTYNGLRVDECLKDSEELDFGRKVVALHTPGHTPGHMVFYMPEGKVLAGGDLIDLETGSGADLNNPHSNYADCLASLERVREMEIEAYLPSHGDPVIGRENVRELLDRMIANTHGYIEDIRKVLSGRESTLTEIFNELMPGTPFTLKAMKMMLVLTTLKHMQGKREVALEKKGGKLIWSLSG